MGSHASAGRRKRPLRRRLLFIGVALGSAILLVEVLAFLTYSLLQGEWFSYSQARAEQLEVVTDDDDEAEVDQGFHDVRIHPYLGYAYRHLFLDDLVEPRGRDAFEILILGGSVAGNFADKGRRTLIAELEKDVSLDGRRVSVSHYTLGGYKQPQQLLALTCLLALGASFDVVVNLDGFNDVVLPVTDNLPFEVHPFYPRSWNQLADLRDPELRRRISEISWLRGIRHRWARGFLDSPLGYSVTMQLLWKVRDHLLSVEIAEQVGELHSTSSDRTSASREKLRSLGFGTEDEARSRLAGFWSSCSIEMQRLCAAHGIRYLHYLQPNQYAGDKPMGEAERSVAFSDDAMYETAARRGYPLLRAQGEVLAAAGVRFCDLTDLYDDEPRPVYTDDCCHLNELGCRLIAERVAADILAK